MKVAQSRPTELIPMSRAVPLLLEKEVPAWRKFDVDQSWETMRPFLLGSPHGSRSSLFVNQETGQSIKALECVGINRNVRSAHKIKIPTSRLNYNFYINRQRENDTFC